MELAKSIEENKLQALESLKELIRIPSEASDPVHTGSGEVYPFGQGVQDAFAYMLSLAKASGFATKNVDNYGGHIDFGNGEETVGVVGHLDVVPALGQDGWDFDPYCGEEKDGFVLGRGTTDDKGPLVAAFYAMKALKEAGYQPAKRVRLILGLDEETNWKGMTHYLQQVPAPDYGFTPDGDFPVINGEMGMLILSVVKKLAKDPGKGLALRKLEGGEAPNIVPEYARAVVRGSKENYHEIRQMAQDFQEETGYKLKVKGVGGSLEIAAHGKASHGARPQDGCNAISVLFQFLGELNFSNEDVNEFVEFYNKHIGFCLDGSELGVGFGDEPSGNLIFNNGMVALEKDAISLNLNLRVPVTKSAQEVYEGMMPFLDAYNLGLVKLREQEGFFYEPEHPLIQTLMDVYREKTEDVKSKPMVIGGGTYAKSCPNTVAFGGLFPGDPDTMHQRNEKMSIERFYQWIDIYAEAIYRLTQPDFALAAPEAE